MPGSVVGQSVSLFKVQPSIRAPGFMPSLFQWISLLWFSALCPALLDYSHQQTARSDISHFEKQNISFESHLPAFSSLLRGEK